MLTSSYDSGVISTLLLALAPVCQDWTPPPPPPVVPSPLLVQPRFAPFVVPRTLRVVTMEPALESLAPVVAESLGVLFGRSVAVGAPPAKSGDVVLTLGYLADAVAEDPEALAIEVFADHVALSGTTSDGVARAAARMFQLFEHDEESGAWSLPPVRIDDAPVYPWRGIELTEPCDADAVRDVVQLAFLSSFNTVVLRGPWKDAPWLADIERYANPRGIRLILEDSASPYVRSDAEGDTSLPVMWVGDPDVKEIAVSLAGRRLIDGASVALRLTPGPATDDARARAFAYRPLGALVDAAPETSSGAFVIGAQVVLDAATRSSERLPDLLPYLVERMWGSRQPPAAPDQFRTRADAFLQRVGVLVARDDRESVPGKR